MGGRPVTPLGYSAGVTAAITDAPLDLPRVATGKVREMFDAGDGRLLMVATDRISVFDDKLPDGLLEAQQLPEPLVIVVAGTTVRYREAYERITGQPFDEYMTQAS